MSDEKEPRDHLSTLIIFALIGIIGYYLVKEHKAHLLGILSNWPFLLFLLLCPLMHLMHGHHHSHKKNNKNRIPKNEE